MKSLFLVLILMVSARVFADQPACVTAYQNTRDLGASGPISSLKPEQQRYQCQTVITQLSRILAVELKMYDYVCVIPLQQRQAISRDLHSRRMNLEAIIDDCGGVGL